MRIRDWSSDVCSSDLLAGFPLALHELHDADLHAVAERAEHQAEGGRRLALALAGVDDEQALLLRLVGQHLVARGLALLRSEEHTSELQSLMRISYAVFCLKKKKKENSQQSHDLHFEN